MDKKRKIVAMASFIGLLFGVINCVYPIKGYNRSINIVTGETNTPLSIAGVTMPPLEVSFRGKKMEIAEDYTIREKVLDGELTGHASPRKTGGYLALKPTGPNASISFREYVHGDLLHYWSFDEGYVSFYGGTAAIKLRVIGDPPDTGPNSSFGTFIIKGAGKTMSSDMVDQLSPNWSTYKVSLIPSTFNVDENTFNAIMATVEDAYILQNAFETSEDYYIGIGGFKLESPEEFIKNGMR